MNLSLFLSSLIFSSFASAANPVQKIILDCYLSAPHAPEDSGNVEAPHSIQKLELNIVVRESASKRLTMSIYRTISGHSLPKEELQVQQLPISKGPIVAYGDQAQNKVILYNLHSRTKEGLYSGLFTNKLQPNSVPLAVVCK